jgi:hypothetical protein
MTKKNKKIEEHDLRHDECCIFKAHINNMAKSNFTDRYDSYTDDDSGIGLDRDYASSNDLNSSRSTLIEPILSTSSTLNTTNHLHDNDQSMVKCFDDGCVQRIRPMTMKNSSNGDYIICRTDRGTYVAYRTPIVPSWVTRLVEEIERQQR